MPSRKNTVITRRDALRGLGTAIALPWLEIMRPSLARGAGAGADVAAKAAGKAAGAAAPPLRAAFVFVPNGVNMDHWRAGEEGSLLDRELPSILQPLEPLKAKINVLTGLAQNNARALGDGPGDHARSLSVFLTGVHPKKTDGADIRAGVSVDQIAAQRVGGATRFPSLELGIDRGAQSGNCDSGYSCAYSSNISWSSPTTPLAKEVDPKLVFERLFGAGDESERLRRNQYSQSILDFVNDEAKRLKTNLGVADRRKLDEYLNSVRELEIRVSRRDNVKPPEDFAKPAGKPADLREHMRLMADLLVIAFQGDLTRISTYMFANEGSNRPYPMIGVSDGHHDLSHHGKDEEKLEKIRKIDQFHMEQFAYFLQRLDSVKEGEGTLLDHSLIVYGSGIGDGNRHNHDDLPILLAGGGNGTVKTGRHLVYSNDTPLNNLYLSMLDRLGAPVDSFGDSTGRLPKLDG